jgi:hypothetical protein
MVSQPSAADRLERERRLEERALAERLRRAAQRPLEENLAAGLELIRTGQTFKAAFEPRSRTS